MTVSSYEYQPSFILGFHGCSRATYEDILIKDTSPHLFWSNKPYDWLGHGIYFWEGSLARAKEWAQDKFDRGDIKDAPCVIGAVIDLRRCLDLFDTRAKDEVKQAHSDLKKAFRNVGKTLPKNVGPTPDKGGRALDCAVMNALHQAREDAGVECYDSVRGPFLEGGRVYPKAGFRTHTHIQICVRNEACIKGYFKPIE